MDRRRIFNIVYFFLCAGVFVWLLRGQVYVRILPVLAGLGLASSTVLLFLSFRKHGFSVDTASLISPRGQRWLRRLAILLPIPALVYFCLYNISIANAGKTHCFNKLCKKIARLEKSAFSKARMVEYARRVQPRLRRMGKKYEHQGKWYRAMSCFKTFFYITKLRGVNYKNAGYYGIQGALYARMGKDRRARNSFAKAELLANKQIQECKASSQVMFVVSAARVLSMTEGMVDEQVIEDFPWSRSYIELRGESIPSEYGTTFVALDLRPVIIDYRTPDRKGEDLILSGSTVRKGLARYAPDQLPAELKRIRSHPDIYSRATTDRYERTSYSDGLPGSMGDLIPPTIIMLDGELAPYFPKETGLRVSGPLSSGAYKITSAVIERNVRKAIVYP